MSMLQVDNVTHWSVPVNHPEEVEHFYQLPPLRIFLRGDIFVEIPLEETYMETCEDQRIAVT